MGMNESDDIKKANHKALPKFVLLAICSTILGMVVGYFASKYGLYILADNLKTAGSVFGTYAAPWIIVAIVVLLPIACVPLYQSARKLLAAWDGEDDEAADEIDEKLHVLKWITDTAIIVDFFLIAAVYAGGLHSFDKADTAALVFVGIAAFIIVLVEGIIIQQKCVDTTKKMNPEKTASIYDIKFQKKWLDSCDEAEKQRMAKSAFSAFNVTNIICMVLAIIFGASALIFETGFLPSLAVCLIWLIHNCAYYREGMK
ncbi:MAG: DUF3169 family protein [Clostridiaceae bacterium]|nr:DUF3169 family protein [Clostridiaceae bacterium]